MSFLGICTYYRRFVKGFAKTAVPLHQLAEPKMTLTFAWKGVHEEALV